MHVQKTLHGYNARQILNKVQTVDTLGGGKKEVVALPTFANTVSHWNVRRGKDVLYLTSGLAEKVIALTPDAKLDLHEWAEG